MTEEIPLLNGAKWAMDLIPIVVDVLSENPGLAKKYQRELLCMRFEAKFVRRTDNGWQTEEGEVLKTKEDLHRHLLWTWLDQFAKPMCDRLEILVSTRDNYRLTNYGQSLAASLGDPRFEDTLRSVVIGVDERNWKVLVLLQKSPLGIAALKQELEQTDVRVRKDEHLRKYLNLLIELGLVKEHLKKPTLTYEVDEDRYARCKTLLKYRTYGDVSDREFVKSLYRAYADKTKAGSSFVDIDELRSAVSRSLNWSEDHFTRRLATIPLRIGQYQLLFSQAAFPRERIGVERKGRYYNYVSIYKRERE